MTNKENTSVTVKEALEQGYIHYVYEDEGFQAMSHINDIELIDWARNPVLVEIESYSPTSISSKEIAENLANECEERHSSESGDDTMQVYEIIDAMDFSDVEERINKALSKLNYYRGTTIKLIP